LYLEESPEAELSFGVVAFLERRTGAKIMPGLKTLVGAGELSEGERRGATYTEMHNVFGKEGGGRSKHEDAFF
jgi:hypothetical protein